jgi:hypothetical protein
MQGSSDLYAAAIPAAPRDLFISSKLKENKVIYLTSVHIMSPARKKKAQDTIVVNALYRRKRGKLSLMDVKHVSNVANWWEKNGQNHRSKYTEAIISLGFLITVYIYYHSVKVWNCKDI